MNRMTCDPERIELFLGQKLSDEEQAAFELHLDHCDDCRQRLEAAAAGDDIWSGVRDSLRGEPSPPDVLRPGESPVDSATGGEALFSHNTVLALLAPTDDDRMLGRLGTYEVVGVVGSTAMGVVLKAFDTALNRYVAIKVLAPHLGSSGAARKRFSREAQAAAAVVHDNVMEIYGVAHVEGLPYLVMPYVRGPSLQRRLDDEGPLGLVEILRIAVQAATGLAAAHAQGLVHRDVKPANILLADGVERVKLTDFGLARAADDASLTKTGIIAGTPQYMSPEQARGDSVDQRSDLFSLGSVLYAMCTGRAPFRAETSYGVLRRIADEEPRPIREINPAIPQWLCRIIAKLMSKRPDERFASAREVAELLEDCLAHVQQPTTVPLPASLVTPPHGSRFFAISRRSLRVAVMIAVLGVGLLGMFAWQASAPPDIAGTWTGDGWGTVLLEAGDGRYEGNYTDSDNSTGTVHLQWSRVERRFNGTWAEGDDRGGRISLRLVGDEIRGAWTTDKITQGAPGKPQLADLLWTRAVKAQPPEPTWITTANTPTRVRAFEIGESVESIACSADGALIAVTNGHPMWLRGLIRPRSGTRSELDAWKPSVEILDAATGKAVVSLKLTTDKEEAALATTNRIAHIAVTALAFSPHGEVVAVGNNFGQVKLFNARTGEMMRSLDDEGAKLADERTPQSWKSLKRAMGTVASLAFSPDGRRLATCGSSFQDFLNDTDRIEHLGERGASPGRVKVWDVESGTLKHDLTAHTHATMVTFSPDGNLLASAGRWLGDLRVGDHGCGVIVWNASAGTKIRAIETQDNGLAHSVAFSPDSRLVAIGSQRFFDKDAFKDGSKSLVSVANIATGIRDWLRPLPSWAGKPLAFSPDGKSVAVLSGDVIRFLDSETGQDKHEIRPPGGKWTDFVFTPQAGMLVIGGVDREGKGGVEVWSTRSRDDTREPASTSPPKSPAAIPARVHVFANLTTGHNVRIACSPDGKRIAIANGNPSLIMRSVGESRVKGDWKPSVQILDAETGKTVVAPKLTTAEEDAVLAATPRISHTEATALAFSPDGNLFAVGTSIGQVKLFDARTGKFLRSLDDEAAKLADKQTPKSWQAIRRAIGSVASLAFSPDGTLLATCGSSFSDFAERFDSVERERLGGHATGPGRLKVWDVSTGKLKHDLVGHNNSANAVAFSPDGHLLASAGRWRKGRDFGNGVILWNPHTGTQIHRLIRTTASGGTRAIAFSPDSKLLAIGTQRFDDDSSTGGVSLVHASSGIVQWLVTVPGWAKPLGFSPDGRSVVVLCGGRSIRFLEKTTGTMTHEIRPAEPLEDVRWRDLAIAQQGHMLAIGGVDNEKKGSVEVWSTRGDSTSAPASTAPPKTTTAKAKSEPIKQFTTTASVRTVALSEDGKLVAVANGGPTLIMQVNGTSRVKDDWRPRVDILDAKTGERVVSLELTTTEEDAVLAATQRLSHVEVEALAFSPDVTLLAVGTSIGQVKLFEARTGELVRSLDDEAAKLADNQTPENWKSLRRALGSVRSLAFSPDGRRLVTCGKSFGDFSDVFDGVRQLGEFATGPGRLKVWDVQTGTLKHDLVGHSHANAVIFSPDGRVFASAGRWVSGRDDGSGVILWDPRTGTTIRRINTTDSGETHSIAFSPDGKLLLIGTQRLDGRNPDDAGKGGVRLVHVSSGITEWLRTVGALPKPVFFPAEHSIVVLGDQQALWFLEEETGKTMAIIRAQATDAGARWNDLVTAKQGRMLAIGGVDHEEKGSLQVWDYDGAGTAANSIPDKNSEGSDGKLPSR